MAAKADLGATGYGAQRTGLVSPKCYATGLADCDGGPATLEHFVSKGLLERLAKEEALVEGLPWIDAPRPLTTNIVAKMLCKRHNNMLSPSDTAVCQLCDALEYWQNGHSVGTVEIDGDALERWALKMLIGFAASGNLCPVDGSRAGAAIPPETWLQLVFSEAALPEGCGFYFSEQPLRTVDHGLVVHFFTAPDGSLIGVGVQLFGFTFIVGIWRASDTRTLWHRPRGFSLSNGNGVVGEILLRWKNDPLVSRIIPLKL